MSTTRSLRELVEDYTLLVVLIVFSGHIYLTAYYSHFGMRLSGISPEFFHVVFRGITAAGTSLYSAIIIILIFTLIFLGDLSFSIRLRKRNISAESMRRFAVLTCFPLAFFLSSTSGYHDAQLDSHPETTSLRGILVLHDEDGNTPAWFDRAVASQRNEGVRAFLVWRDGGDVSIIVVETGIKIGASRPSVMHAQLTGGTIYVDAQANNSRRPWRSFLAFLWRNQLFQTLSR